MNKCFMATSSVLAIVALSLPMSSWSAQSELQSKTFTGEVTDSICAPSGSHAATMAKTPGMGSDSASCTKKCVAMGAKYVLVDQSSHATYTLDDSDKVAQFAGHKVKVTGSLNGAALKVGDVSEIA